MGEGACSIEIQLTWKIGTDTEILCIATEKCSLPALRDNVRKWTAACTGAENHMNGTAANAEWCWCVVLETQTSLAVWPSGTWAPKYGITFGEGPGRRTTCPWFSWSVRFRKIQSKLKLWKILCIDSQCSLFADSMLWFRYLLQLTYDPEVDPGGAFAVIPEPVQSSENFQSPMCSFPAKVRQQDSAFLLQLPYCKQGSFLGLFGAMFFALVADFAVVSSPQA